MLLIIVKVINSHQFYLVSHIVVVIDYENQTCNLFLGEYLAVKYACKSSENMYRIPVTDVALSLG